MKRAVVLGVSRSVIQMADEDSAALPVVEPTPAPEFFVEEIVDIEVRGSLLHITLCSPERLVETGKMVRLVKVRLVVPLDRAHEMVARKAAALRSPAARSSAVKRTN
jgi:hypothetical protein